WVASSGLASSGFASNPASCAIFASSSILPEYNHAPIVPTGSPPFTNRDVTIAVRVGVTDPRTQERAASPIGRHLEADIGGRDDISGSTRHRILASQKVHVRG